MTTIIVKKTSNGMEVVADKQSTGGHNLLQTNKSKLFNINVFLQGETVPIVFGLAGDCIHNELVERALCESLYKKNNKGDDYTSIYEVGIELRDSLMAHSQMKETDIHLILATNDQCITISNAGTIEDMSGMIAIGSGFILAQGIHLGNPDLDIQKYIPLIHTKDEKTSSTFDYLKL